MKKFLNKLIIFQVLTAILLIALNIYLYKFHFQEAIIQKDKVNNIEDNSISNYQAEQKSIESLIKKNSNNNSDLKEIKFAKENENGLVKTYLYTNGVIEKTLEYNSNQVPVIYTNQSNSIEIVDFINTIQPLVLQNNEIDLDISILNKIASVDKFLIEFYKLPQNLNFKINLHLPAKWSDIHNYGRFSSFTNYYLANADIEIINKYVNNVKLYAIEFTPVFASKPGPIANVSWIEQVIRYYIYKGLNPNKIYLGINTNGYLWPNRIVTNNYLENFILSEKQAKIINSTEIEKTLKFKTQDLLFEYNDNFALLNIENVEYVFIYPKLSTIEELKEVAKDYNLKGYLLI